MEGDYLIRKTNNRRDDKGSEFSRDKRKGNKASRYSKG